MREEKRKRLEAKGWRVGNAAEFLQLTAGEAAYIDLKLKLASHLRKRREKWRLSQSALAGKLRSSQSRVAKMEVGDTSVSIDLLIRSLLTMGASQRELARVITRHRPAAAG